MHPVLRRWIREMRAPQSRNYNQRRGKKRGKRREAKEGRTTTVRSESGGNEAIFSTLMRKDEAEFEEEEAGKKGSDFAVL